MAKPYCANSNCTNRVDREGEFCAECSDQDGIYLDKHEGERVTRDRRLKVNNRKQKSED